MRAARDTAIGSEGAIRQQVLKGIDEILWEDVERALIENPIPPCQGQSLYTGDKWLTTSALQKSVRRGHVDLAERYARSSVRIDANHTFRRLAIIALEDVGLGDLKLVAASLAVLGSKRRRQRLGEERLAAHLAIRMSEAVKSRLACEMLSLVEYDEEAGRIAELLMGSNAVILSNIVQNEEFGSTRQLVSLWLLHGTERLRSPQLAPIAGEGQRGLLKLLATQKTPLIFHYVVRMGLSRCRDSLAIPYVVLAKFADQNPHLNTVGSDIPRPELIGSYPSFAYDMHTRIGRQAIKEFEVNCTRQLRTMGVRDVGNLVFALEGGILDTRLKGDRISRISEDALLLEVFGRDQSYANIWKVRADLLSLLDEIRRQVAVSV